MRQIKVVAILCVLIFIALFSMKAEAQDIKAIIEDSINTVEANLDSVDSKYKLALIVLRFHESRRMDKPMKYEADDSYSDSFMVSYNLFFDALFTKKLNTISEKINKDDIVKMVASYQKYGGNFESYVAGLRSRDSVFFGALPDNTVLRSQMYFSLMLAVFQKDQWEKARGFTHVWPFCK